MVLIMSQDRHARSQLHSRVQPCHMLQGQIDPDGALHLSASTEIRHYRSVHANRSDPIAFMPIVVSTSGLIYPDFIRLFLQAHRDASALANALPEESDQYSCAPAWLLLSFSFSRYRDTPLNIFFFFLLYEPLKVKAGSATLRTEWSRN